MALLYSSAALVRGQLKHSWLENQILNKSADDVVSLRDIGWPALESEFPKRMLQARDLLDQIESGFSPAQLIDRLDSFSGLPAEQKYCLKRAVHSAFLEIVDIELWRGHLFKAVELFESALNELLSDWKMPTTMVTQSKLCADAVSFLESARLLYAALDRLPREIVLP